jgi:predicted membrane metal-binding protein
MERAYRSLTKRTEEYPVTYPIGRRGKVFSFLAVTVSAQLFTAPVLIDAYGYLSAWGLLLNILFVPCVGFIFSLTLGFSALACFLPSSFSVVFLWIPNLLWNISLLIFQTLDFPVIFDSVTQNGLAVFCYYSFLIVLSGKFNVKKNEKKFLLCILALSCVCAYIIL